MIEILLLAGFALAGLGSTAVMASDVGTKIRQRRREAFAARAAEAAVEDPAPLGDPYRTAASEGSPLVTPAMEVAFRRAMIAQELGHDAEGHSLRSLRKTNRKAASSGPTFERLRRQFYGEFHLPTWRERMAERFRAPMMAEEAAALRARVLSDEEARKAKAADDRRQAAVRKWRGERN